MSNLTIINQDGQLLVESRQVAEMVDKPHNDLMKTIRQYCEYLNQGNFSLVDFFIENTYLDGKGETRPCYLITRKGCDMVANKMTGEKGVLFTATYVTKFEEMENQLKGLVPVGQYKIEKYQKKSTSVGEVSNLVKTLRTIMKDEKHSPEDIANMTEMICKQFNIALPENFVKVSPFEQLSLQSLTITLGK